MKLNYKIHKKIYKRKNNKETYKNFYYIGYYQHKSYTKPFYDYLLGKRNKRIRRKVFFTNKKPKSAIIDRFNFVLPHFLFLNIYGTSATFNEIPGVVSISKSTLKPELNMDGAISLIKLVLIAKNPLIGSEQ